MTLDDQRFYPVSASHVTELAAGACIALKAFEVTPASGNEVEMVRASAIVKRIMIL